MNDTTKRVRREIRRSLDTARAAAMSHIRDEVERLMTVNYTYSKFELGVGMAKMSNRRGEWISNERNLKTLHDFIDAFPELRLNWEQMRCDRFNGCLVWSYNWK